MSKYTNDETAILDAIEDTAAALMQAQNSLNHGDPLEALARFSTAQANAEAVERQLVALARSGGTTWQEIADTLGISRQSAHAHYRD